MEGDSLVTWKPAPGDLNQESPDTQLDDEGNADGFIQRVFVALNKRLGGTTPRLQFMRRQVNACNSTVFFVLCFKAIISSCWLCTVDTNFELEKYFKMEDKNVFFQRVHRDPILIVSVCPSVCGNEPSDLVINASIEHSS